MRRFVTLVLAVGVLAVALGMAAVSARQRAGSPVDRALMVALSCAVVCAVHLLPALRRDRATLGLWGVCFAAAVYGHAVFLANAGQQAAEDRRTGSAHTQSLKARQAAIREALQGIQARPVSVVAANLARSTAPERRQALEEELAEARRAAGLRDELVTVAATLANGAMTEGVTDPVTQGLARVWGVSAQAVTLVVNMVTAALVELLGAVLWSHALRHPKPSSSLPDRADPIPEVTSADPLASHCDGVLTEELPVGVVPDPLVELRVAIERGECRATVSAIRAFLSCSQSRAMQIRRELVGVA